MALQAHHPSNGFSPDFRGRVCSDIMEELQMMQGREQQIGNLAGAYALFGDRLFSGHLPSPSVDLLQLIPDLNPLMASQICNTTAFSEPQSQLTCNAVSVSRKRSRDDPSLIHSKMNLRPSIPLKPQMKAEAGDEQSRLFESAGASTSGRVPAIAGSPLAQIFASHLQHQSAEVDALIRLHTQKLRSGLEESRKRHCSALISVLDSQSARRLQEKDLELEAAIRRNAELEEMIRRISAENQIWFTAAKNSEAIACSLKQCLEQLLLQPPADGAPAAEGFGDSGDVTFPANDAASCCFEDGAVASSPELRRACRVCKNEEVSVLLLPCRHLCLCKDCEPKLDTCPICGSAKNASLQIFVS